MNEINWQQTCPLGIRREIAAQHGRCASCPKYHLTGLMKFPNKCDWKGWDKAEGM